MSEEVNVSLLESAMELRETCDRLVARLMESAGSDPVKQNTVKTIEILFTAQSDLIANLLEIYMINGDFIAKLNEEFKPK